MAFKTPYFTPGLCLLVIAWSIGILYVILSNGEEAIPYAIAFVIWTAWVIYDWHNESNRSK